MFSGIGPWYSDRPPLTGTEIKKLWERLDDELRASVDHFTGREIGKYDVKVVGRGAPEPRPFKTIWFDELAEFFGLRVSIPARHLCARPSDLPGIDLERSDPPAPKIVQPSSVKPAISGLGTSAPVTHRLGGFGAVECD